MNAINEVQMFGTAILCSEQFQESVLHFQHLFRTSLDIILQILYQKLYLWQSYHWDSFPSFSTPSFSPLIVSD